MDRFIRLAAVSALFSILAACQVPVEGKIPGAEPVQGIPVPVELDSGRGLADDSAISSVYVDVVNSGGTNVGTGLLNKVVVEGGPDKWAGSISVSDTGSLTFRAQARNSAGLPIYTASAGANITGAGDSVSLALEALSSTLGSRAPGFGRGSVKDLNGAAAGAGWGAASFDLGANFTSGYGSTLQVGVYSANATKVLLEIYSAATGENAALDYWMEKGADNIWRASVDMEGNTGPVLYAFRVWGPNWPYDDGWTRGHSAAGFSSDVDSDGHRFNPNKVLYDPYTREMSHDKETPAMTAAGEDGGMYGTGGTDVLAGQTYEGPLTGNVAVNRRNVDTGKWAPKSVAIADTTGFGTKPAIAQKDASVYEAHVRGLTNHTSSSSLTTILSGISGFESVVNVPADYRGTYKGAAYMAKYLKALGINTLELLPVHETANDINPEDASGGNFWGYMTYGYFAPDRRYAYDKSLGGPTREFKEMMAAFHAEGIEVYLDVVYNHTGEGGTWDASKQAAELTSFRGLDNAGYYALVDADKAGYWETTGCGNNFDASKTVVKDLIKDSLAYWTEVMGVDGFRFDLAPVLGRDTAPGYAFNPNATLLTDIASYGAAQNVEMIAEAWDTQWPGGYQVSNFPSGWGEWNGFYRDAVRKFIKGGGNKTSGYPSFTDVFHGSYGPLDRSSGNTHTGFNDQGGPHKSVNFVVAHDGFTLADVVSYNVKSNTTATEPEWPFGPSDGGSNDNDSWNYDGDLQLRRQSWRNFWVVQMFSRGVPMIVYGDEFGRTQNGNNNTYNVDSVATWNNYNQIASDTPQGVATGGAGTYDNNLGTDPLADGKNGLFKFAAKILNLRKSEPALRSDSYGVNFSYARNDGTGLTSTDRAVRIHIDGSSVSGGSDYLLAINTFTGDVPFTLPAPDAGTNWVRIIATNEWTDSNAVDHLWSESSAYAHNHANTYGVAPWSITVFKAVSAVESPVLSTNGAAYVAGTPHTITFTSGTPGASFRYNFTSDGSVPADPTASSGTPGSSVEIPGTVGTYKLKAVAFKDGMRTSAVTSATFTVTEADVTLSSLSLSTGGLTFDGSLSYAVNLTNTAALTVTAAPTDNDGSATLEYRTWDYTASSTPSGTYSALTSGAASGAISLHKAAAGSNTSGYQTGIEIKVTNGGSSASTTIVVSRTEELTVYFLPAVWASVEGDYSKTHVNFWSQSNGTVKGNLTDLAEGGSYVGLVSNTSYCSWTMGVNDSAAAVDLRVKFTQYDSGWTSKYLTGISTVSSPVTGFARLTTSTGILKIDASAGWDEWSGNDYKLPEANITYTAP